MASDNDARPAVVVGVDGSDESVAALRWAARYAAAAGASVRAVLCRRQRFHCRVASPAGPGTLALLDRETKSQPPGHQK